MAQPKHFAASSGLFPAEKKAMLHLAGMMFFRMFGVFVLLPIFSLYALEFPQATTQLIGIAFGVYGLTQALFQIPFGLLSDRWSRKNVLIIGFSLFVAGCLVSALAQNVYWLILGRLLQGTGAVSSTLIALLSDKVRTQYQTRAMAVLGMSIGLAFAVAFLVSPFLASWIGLRGIFVLLSGIGVLLITYLLFQKEAPKKQKSSANFTQILILLRSNSINLPLFANFLSSFGLAVFLFNLPLAMSNLGWEKSELWQVYLPMLLIGGAVMFPAAFVAEKYKQFRKIFGLAVVFILVATIMMVFVSIHWIDFSAFWMILASYLFFTGFNIFEPLLPSFITKASPKELKGSASGCLSFFQFFGQFLGAVTAGFWRDKLQILPYGIIVILGLFLFLWTIQSKQFRVLE